MLRITVTFVVSILAYLLILPVLFILVPIWIFSSLVNSVNALLGMGDFSPWSYTPWEGIVRFEPEIGWVPRANLDTMYLERTGDICSVKTDSEGWPGEPSIEESDVVAFGDSFAFGYGVDSDRAYYSLVKGCKVKPIAVPGYNMVQALMLMRRYSDRLKGKTIVWFICTENDLIENVKAYLPKIGYRTPYIRNIGRSDDWEVVSEHVKEERWLFGEERANNKQLFAKLCSPTNYAERIYSATKFLIQEAKKLCDEAECRMVIFAIPFKDSLSQSGRRNLRKLLADVTSFDTNIPVNKIHDICDQVSVPYISGVSELTLNDYKVRDGHWNVNGNRKVAKMIGEYHCCPVKSDLGVYDNSKITKQSL